MKTVFEDDTIKVSETGRNYGFIAIVENKTDKNVFVIINDEEAESYRIDIPKNDWVGLLANEEDYLAFAALKGGQFTIENKIEIKDLNGFDSSLSAV